MRHPGEREQVVFAGAPDLDVAHQHHLVVAEVEGGRQDLGGVGLQPVEDLRVRAGDPHRGVAQALAVGVLSDADQDLPDGGGHPLGVYGHRWSGRFASGPG